MCGEVWSLALEGFYSRDAIAELTGSVFTATEQG